MPLTFANPQRLWLLVACLALGLWALWGRAVTLRMARALRLAEQPRTRGAWLLILAAAAASVAAARPQVVTRTEHASTRGRDVILALDVSLSMAADDAIPNRLGAAVDAAESLVRALALDRSSRAGVVAFAGKGVPRCPLTENLGAVSQVLRTLTPGNVRPGGTDLAAALEAATELLDAGGPSAGQAIVLFSDGEDHAERWQNAARSLKERGIAVHTIALGDDQVGRTLPSPSGAHALTYEGQTVLSRRVDSTLKELAASTGGTFVALGLSRADLGALYVSRIEPAARKRAPISPLRRADWQAPFLGGALALAAAGSWNWGWKRRPRTRTLRATQPAAAAAALLAIATTLATPGAAPSDRSAARNIARGLDHFKKREFEQALEAFSLAVEAAPKEPVAHYDRAAALFELGRYQDAFAGYLKARASAGPALQVKIDYALGNTVLALGDLEGAIQFYDSCLGARVSAPGLDRVKRDAAANRAFAVEHAKSRSETPSNAEQPPQEQAKQARTQPADEPNPTADESLTKARPAPKGSGSGQARPGENPAAPRGGQGGSSNTPPPPRTRPPEDRLNDALDHIARAQRDRLPDESNPAPPRDDHKDW